MEGNGMRGKKGKPVKMYVENNICYGRDTKGKNIVLLAFTPLKFVEHGDFYSIVKPKGRGNHRHYLVKNDLLQYQP